MARPGYAAGIRQKSANVSAEARKRIKTRVDRESNKHERRRGSNEDERRLTRDIEEEIKKLEYFLEEAEAELIEIKDH